MIMMLPLKSITTSFFPNYTRPMSYVLLLAAMKGKFIEFTGFGPDALFLAKSIRNFFC
jgi:hypothetical protein